MGFKLTGKSPEGYEGDFYWSLGPSEIHPATMQFHAKFEAYLSREKKKDKDEPARPIKGMRAHIPMPIEVLSGKNPVQDIYERAKEYLHGEQNEKEEPFFKNATDVLE